MKSKARIRKGEIVHLSSLVDSDSKTLFTWINDRELVILSAPYRKIDPASHQAWFTSIRSRSDVQIFGIRLAENDNLIGSCQLHSIDPISRSAELQIRIGDRASQSRGAGTEACRLLLEHAFQNLKLHRVYLHVFETNETAINLYKRSGFTTEGVLRKSVLIEGQWLNVLVMAILQDEFK